MASYSHVTYHLYFAYAKKLNGFVCVLCALCCMHQIETCISQFTQLELYQIFNALLFHCLIILMKSAFSSVHTIRACVCVCSKIRLCREFHGKSTTEHKMYSAQLVNGTVTHGRNDIIKR